MKLVIPPLIIEESDSFKNDVLNRKAYGEALLNLVKSSSDELVISLDGRWGEGKTTFVKMWQGLLSESNIPNIYIDAFANDYLDDAFISGAGDITAFGEENIEEDSGNKLSELKSKMKKMVWYAFLLRTSLLKEADSSIISGGMTSFINLSFVMCEA
jgi:energy-coupling factor transporter ATP-binding protein EcfA2